MRRASLAVLRILIETERDVDLTDLCKLAGQQYADQLNTDEAIDEVVDYVMDRLRGYYQEQGINFDVVDAVKACSGSVLIDIDQRVKALNTFLQQDAAIALAAANKRIANILKKQGDSVNDEINASIFELDQEKSLYEQINRISGEVSTCFQAKDYLQGLDKLSALRPVVDEFFDHVMVMAGDEALRNNRIALLSSLVQQFRQVADFSRLQS